MKVKTLALVFIVATAGMLIFTRTKNAPPSDLRDAVAEDLKSQNFNTAIPPIVENNDGNLPNPTAVAVDKAALAAAGFASKAESSKTESLMGPNSWAGKEIDFLYDRYYTFGPHIPYTSRYYGTNDDGTDIRKGAVKLFEYLACEAPKDVDGAPWHKECLQYRDDMRWYYPPVAGKAENWLNYLKINIVRKTVKVLGPPILKPANLVSGKDSYGAFFWEIPIELYAEHTLVYYKQDSVSLNDWAPYGNVVKGKLVVGGFSPSPSPVFKYVAASIKDFLQREIIAAVDRRTAEDSVLLIFKLCSYTKLPVAAQVCSIAGKAGNIAFDITETGGVSGKTLASLAMGVVIDSVMPPVPLPLNIPVDIAGSAALSGLDGRKDTPLVAHFPAWNDDDGYQALYVAVSFPRMGDVDDFVNMR